MLESCMVTTCYPHPRTKILAEFNSGMIYIDPALIV